MLFPDPRPLRSEFQRRGFALAPELLFMDGTRCPHAVAPLTESTLRLTVPMVYPTERIDRPAGLDEYLYGQ